MAEAGNSADPAETQIVLRYFAFGFLLAALLAILLAATGLPQGPIPDQDASSERIRPLADPQIALPAAPRGQRTGSALVQQYCRSCHQEGLGGAPKIGDRKAWDPRLERGLQTLVESAIAGKSSMPPRGGSDADDSELARAIVYMIWPRMRL